MSKRPQPHVKANREAKEKRRARRSRASGLQHALDGAPIGALKWQDPNPHEVDINLATVAHAQRYDEKYHQVQQAQQAAKNPRFPCPQCGAIVRLGSGGGLWDVRKRTGHWNVCGGPRVATPDEIDAMRSGDKPAAEKKQSAHRACADCGKHAAHCTC